MFINRSRRFIFITAVIILSSLSAFAQNSATISGTVTDSTGAAVIGATVRALNVASSREKVMTTDDQGNFTFADVSAGNYRLSATSPGFAASAENVFVGRDANITRNFTLAPGAIQDTVTVTAGKGAERIAVEVPQVITVATAEQIERRVPRSTFEAIERAPNLSVVETNPARERPRLRGFASNRLLIVIDGEKLNNARTDPGASGAQLAIIDPTQLEAIEVVAGSGSSLYGSDAIGGTINLVTKAPTRPLEGLLLGARLDGNYFTNGAIGRGNATLNLSNTQVAFRANASLYRNENYRMGGDAVSLQEVLDVGNFYLQIPTNVAGTTFNSAAGYPVFELPANAEILNGQGRGGGTQFDVWFYPSEKHIFRGKYLGRGESNLGNAFSGPPYETQERYNAFRNFSKFGIRYEGLDLNRFIPRVAVGYYHQNNVYPQNQFTYVNVAGAGGSYLNANTFTGLPSQFDLQSYVDNVNSVASYGIDLQATLLPFRGLFITVGGGRTQDDSKDYFFSTSAEFAGGERVFTGVPTIGASSPISTYTDNNFYVQGEFDRIKWVRLSAGVRYDNWVTAALPGGGFPLSTEFAVLNAAAPALLDNPGALQQVADALPDLIALAAGTGTAGSNRNSITANFGVVGRLPWGINPYFRVSNSYREPAITERYLIRNFAPGSFFAPIVIGNPNLEPEKGLNYDVGVKIQQRFFSFTLGYFQNTIDDLLVYAPGQSYCVNPVPGVLPGDFASKFILPGCPPLKAIVNINARINQDQNVIYGWESTGEGSIPLGDFGSLNPFYTFGALHGENKNPTPQQITIFNQLYNRSDTPIELTGSLDDFPLGNITPFRIIGGAQFLDAKGRFYAEYSWRHQNKVTRVDPNTFVGQTLINYGTFAGLNSFDKHSIKGGYNWTNEKYKFSVNAGIDNLTDELYWEHFQNAPAPGRSFIIGFTMEVFNFLKK